MQIHFLSDIYRFVVIQKFCYHGNVTYRLLLSFTLAIWVRVRVRSYCVTKFDQIWTECWKLKISLPLGHLIVSLLRSTESNNHELWNIGFIERHRACFLD